MRNLSIPSPPFRTAGTAEALTGLGPPVPAPDDDAPLDIAEARSWATWQLATTALAAAIVGMMIGYSGKKPGASGPTSGIVSLGPLSASPTGKPPTVAPTTVVLTTHPPTTVPPTTVPSAPTTLSGAVATVLVPNTVGKGTSDLPSFTVGGPWSIGWHFRCVQAPDGSAAFNVSVVPDAGGVASPAVDQTSRDAQGIANQTAPGKFHLKVTTDPACQWAIKVTGVAG